MRLRGEKLQEVVAELARRPRHEKVRTLLYRLLTDALDAESAQILFEQPVPEVRGRIDALLGRTIFEIKSDLRREGDDAVRQLARYLAEREAATGQRYVGVATDGASFRAYELAGGDVRLLSEHQAKASDATALVAWLDGAVAVQDTVAADAPAITAELGRESTAFARVEALLAEAWAALRDHPEATLKRQLWTRHLAHVYGRAMDDDRLWLQHTYLVTVAKAIASGAMGLPAPDPRALLSGSAFVRAGVRGAVEEDLFGWILDAPGGPDIVAKLADHVRRFDLGSVDVDVLKVLYESLVDPEQRHELGEYYTPDWLARKVVRRALGDPVRDRVLDPSCGSGSFLFHAIRAKTEALAAAGVPIGAVAKRVCDTVTGIDVHPVAVIFARVTYLLALGRALVGRDEDVSVPVYLGDALQWNVRRDTERDLVIDVPPDPRAPRKGAPTLRFPLALCAEPVPFDRVAERMQEASEQGRSVQDFARGLPGLGVPEALRPTLEATYGVFKALHDAGRDHVWTFVARNLSRPVALSEAPERQDVIVGNPPWLSYRYMTREMQRRFAESARALGVWVGEGEAKLVTQTDLSGLFYARAAQLYLRDGGRIAMVLPMAALTRGQFRAFRTGAFIDAPVAFDEAWMLDNQDVSPLFRVPTCVLFARRTRALAQRVPATVTRFFGRLPFKDAPEEIADGRLRTSREAAPTEVALAGGSPYRERFRQGATLVPRMLCLVERVEGGRLGVNPAAPLVRSRRSPQEKTPWKELPALEGAVEAAFLRPVWLGESIAPFRALGAMEGVVPVTDGGDRIDARVAAQRGWLRLADWMQRAEELWNTRSAGARTLMNRWDFQRALTGQFPPKTLRVIYGKAGMQPAACLVSDPRGVIDHKLYWAAVDTLAEGRYLTAILNSETARARIAHMQSRGEQGARDFDKLMFTLPIPRFDPRDPVHGDLVEAAERAEGVAAAVAIAPGTAFVAARKAVRTALAADGVAARIDGLVARLLDGAPAAVARRVSVDA